MRRRVSSRPRAGPAALAAWVVLASTAAVPSASAVAAEVGNRTGSLPGDRPGDPPPDPREPKIGFRERGWMPEGWRFALLPGFGYDPDSGLGIGALGTLYRYERSLEPYSWALRASGYATTKGFQRYLLRWDDLELGRLPLRLTTKLEISSEAAAHYCGIGGGVTCDPGAAEAAADARGLEEGKARDEFLRRYYLMRYVEPKGTVELRWQLEPMPYRVELMGGVRVALLRSGTLTADGPYPGSLYEAEHPGGEEGTLSVVQLGAMFDARDNEPAPTSGYWFEASARGGGPATGSDFPMLGAHLRGSVYVPLHPSRRLVWATRLLYDVLFGDAPVRELGGFGGSGELTGYGGHFTGRGIRAERYRGPVRGVGQTELRWECLRTEMFGGFFDYTLAAFVDLGAASRRLDFAASPPVLGAGLGLRVAINANFIGRIDVGASEVEGWTPGLYLAIGHPY